MDSILVDSILVILGPFRIPPEFHGMEITILAGSTAKIPFRRIPGINRNRPDSGGFQQEYMEDCKELPEEWKLAEGFANIAIPVDSCSGGILAFRN